MESYAQTDVGLKRNNNQDFVYASDHRIGPLDGLLVVADGMGGQAAGDLASRLCVEAMVDVIEGSADSGTVRVLSKAIRAANRAVCERARTDPGLEGMGTTLVAAVPDHGCLYVANVGDSRLYIVDDDRIEQITHDHSLVEELIRNGQLDRNKGRNHPEKNIITRAMGSRNEAVPDFFEISLTPGDRILMCSDGLSNMVENDELRDIVRENEDLDSVVTSLIERANYYGGNDNISAVVISV